MSNLCEVADVARSEVGVGAEVGGVVVVVTKKLT